MFHKKSPFDGIPYKYNEEFISKKGVFEVKMRIRKILGVCNYNEGRSALFVPFLKYHLGNISQLFKIDSAGIRAYEDNKINPYLRNLLYNSKIDKEDFRTHANKHRSKLLTDELIQNQDLLVFFERTKKNTIDKIIKDINRKFQNSDQASRQIKSIHINEINGRRYKDIIDPGSIITANETTYKIKKFFGYNIMLGTDNNKERVSRECFIEVFNSTKAVAEFLLSARNIIPIKPRKNPLARVGNHLAN